MPIYKMKCPKCDYEEEWFCSYAEYQRKMKEEPCGACRQNGRGMVEMKQMITDPTFVLKGRGWGHDGYSKPKE